MRLTLRSRILFTVFPQLVLLFGLGIVAVVLLYRLGGNINALLRENYDSVIYMERLKEALERIDSSFTFALAGQEKKAKDQFEKQWKVFDDTLSKEEKNITIVPEEGRLVEKIKSLRIGYWQTGNGFYKIPIKEDSKRKDAYFGQGGLLSVFKEIKNTADEILRLNQEKMEEASLEARQVASDSLIGFIIALAAAAFLGVFLAWRTLHAILQPIQFITQSAHAIGAGNLDQVVPVMARDELGQLAESFNSMVRQLRHYRQTDYSRLLRAQRTSQATIDSFPFPIMVVDPEGRVEMANPAAQRILGVTARHSDQIAQLPWQPPETLREPLRQALQDQHPYSPDEFDRAISLRVDGKDHSFLPRLLPIRDPYGNTLGAAVLLEDVTRFRLLDQVKSDLVATASHELKTPLTSIRLAHHLLLEEKVGTLTGKQTELLLDARDNTERLLAMVNSLLDLARLEKGQDHLDFQVEGTEKVVQVAVENLRPRAEDKGIAVVVQVAPHLPSVRIDQQRLGHALANLLDNALTYTDRGGTITLSAKALADRVLFSVADTGVGIPPEYLPHVFDKFFRIPDQTRGVGTGLGLAIVREIVVAHGGTITCESKPGEGSVFWIDLPAWQNQTSATDETGMEHG